MIKLDAFDHFKLEGDNKEYLEEGKFGVLVVDLENNDWTPTFILEGDFARYTHQIYYDTFEQREELLERAKVLGETYKMWPLVKKIEW